MWVRRCNNDLLYVPIYRKTHQLEKEKEKEIYLEEAETSHVD